MNHHMVGSVARCRLGSYSSHTATFRTWWFQPVLRWCSPASLVEMFGNTSSWQGDSKSESEKMEQPKPDSDTIPVCIPKVEPCYPNNDDSNDDLGSFKGIEKSPIPFSTPYKLKDPIVLLERCDKIWETLKLIKSSQSIDTDTDDSDNTDDTRSNVSTASTALLTDFTEPGPSYIKYQPVLGNNNTALPNFRFSVKTTKRLYHCSTCGKQYTENRSLRHHSERVHGIYIPLQRRGYRRSEVISKEIVPEVKKNREIEKGKINIEESQIESNAREQTKKLQAATPFVKEIEKVHSYARSHRKSKISLGSNTDKVPVNRAENEEYLTKLEKEVHQRPRRNCATLILCALCKQLVKDIKKHLIEYHKIGCADVMLKELGKTLTSEVPATVKTQTLQKAVPIDNASLINRSTAVSQDDASNPGSWNDRYEHLGDHAKRKREGAQLNLRKRSKLNNNDISSEEGTSEYVQVNRNATKKSKKNLQCDICFGVYSNSWSLRRHMNFHHERGETKENFHLFECKYHKSPLCSKSKLPVPVNSLNSTNITKHKETKDQVSDVSNNIEDRELSKAAGEQSEETTCCCGRSFRNPHTLFIHKTNCKLQGDQDVNASNCSDKDSGIGISITIKKRNNSYEVVSRDSDDENKSKDSSYMRDSETSSDVSDYSSKDYANAKKKDQQVEIQEISKYSKYHSILKLESVNEDIHVDIEEDSQNNSCNNVTNTKQSTSTPDDNSLKNEGVRITQPTQNISRCQIVPKLTVLCQKIVDARKESCSIEDESAGNELCPCGKRFQTITALDIHMVQCYRSAPFCGYCLVKFADSDEWSKHECTVERGKALCDTVTPLRCHYCAIPLSTKKLFHQHIRRNHFHPATQFHCTNCPKRFSSQVMRDKHFTEEHSILSCVICDKKFYHTVMYSHESYHRGLGFPCHICRRAYSTKAAVVNHQKFIHSLTHCELCKKLYRTKSSHQCPKEICVTET